VVKKVPSVTALTDQRGHENPWAAWMMTEPQSGFCLPGYQSYIGPILVYRPGGIDLTGQEVELLVDFLGSVFCCYENDEFDYKSMLNPHYFKKWIEKRAKERNIQTTLFS